MVCLRFGADWRNDAQPPAIEVPLRALIYFSLCTLGMTGFWYLCDFLITHTSEAFSDGLVIGVAITIVLVYLAERVSGRSWPFRSNRDL